MTEAKLLKDSKTSPSAEVIYNLIGSVISYQIPKSIVVVVQLDTLLKKAYVHSFYGLGIPWFNKLISILGLNPVGKHFEITKDGKKYYFTHKQFRKFNGSVYEFTGGQVAEWIIRSAEMLFNIREIYTLAINSDGIPFGTVLVLNRTNNPPDFEGLEDFVNEAAHSLKKIVSENNRELQVPTFKDAFTETLLNNLSHEIRTPLNGILGILEVVKSEVQSKKIIDSSLFENAWTNANDLTRNIDSLVMASELTTNSLTINPQPMSNGQIIEAFNKKLKKFKQSFPDRSIHLKVGSYDNYFIMADLNKFEFVIEELLLNAIKFSETDVDVFIDFDEYLKICITDYGIGMPKKETEVIFDHFAKIPSNNRIYRGLGLGLFICSGILKMHQGNIHLNSQPMTGTSVIISIPVLPPGKN